MADGNGKKGSQPVTVDGMREVVKGLRAEFREALSGALAEIKELIAGLQVQPAPAEQQEAAPASGTDQAAAILSEPEPQPPAPQRIGILGKEPVPAKAEEKPGEPEEPAEEPAEAGEAASPGDLLKTLAARSAEAKAEADRAWTEKRQAAHNALGAALEAGMIRIDSDAEFVDQETDYASRAHPWLVTRIAKGQMSVEEAIAYAQEKGWTVELEIRPTVYREMIEGFNSAGLWLVRTARVNGDEVDVQVLIGKALESGEITLEEAIQQARAAGWTRILRDPDSSIGAHLRAKQEAEAEQDQRDRTGKKGKKKGKKK